MPGWRVYRFIDLLNFGRSYYKIHEEMDWPWKILGKDHRKYFHDPLSAPVIAEHCYPDDPNAVEAAYVHILLDQLCSARAQCILVGPNVIHSVLYWGSVSTFN